MSGGDPLEGRPGRGGAGGLSSGYCDVGDGRYWLFVEEVGRGADVCDEEISSYGGGASDMGYGGLRCCCDGCAWFMGGGECCGGESGGLLVSGAPLKYSAAAILVCRSLWLQRSRTVLTWYGSAKGKKVEAEMQSEDQRRKILGRETVAVYVMRSGIKFGPAGWREMSQK